MRNSTDHLIAAEGAEGLHGLNIVPTSEWSKWAPHVDGERSDYLSSRDYYVPGCGTATVHVEASADHGPLASVEWHESDSPLAAVELHLLDEGSGRGSDFDIEDAPTLVPRVVKGGRHAG